MPRRRNKNKRNTYQRKQTRAYTRSTKPRLRSAVFNNQYSAYNNAFVESRRTRQNTYTRTKSKIIENPTNITTNNRLKNNNTTPLPYSVHKGNFLKTMVCVRRQQRKEVLHAIKKTGQAGQKRPRRNQYSNIKCTH